MISNISSAQNPIIKNIHKQTRDSKSGWIIIESQNLLSECLKLPLDVQHFLCTQGWYDKYKHLVKQYYQNTIITTPEILSKLSFAQTPQEFLIIVNYQISSFEVSAKNSYFILDQISDPGNLGTMLRNAVAFNFTHLFISKNSVSPLNEKVVRASMSAILKTKIVFYDDLLTVVKQLKTLKIDVFASVVDAQSIALDSLIKYNPSAFILGNEAHGIKDSKVLSVATKVCIPIQQIESLNVASASAIFMYTWNQLRQKCKK